MGKFCPITSLVRSLQRFHCEQTTFCTFLLFLVLRFQSALADSVTAPGSGFWVAWALLLRCIDCHRVQVTFV
jgi:hypothetical protein